MTKDKKYNLLEATVKEFLLIAALAEQDDTGSIAFEDSLDGAVLEKWVKIKKRAIWLLQQEVD